MSDQDKALREEGKVKELIAGRIVDEFRKHHNLEWHKIAASKIYTQWAEFYESQLSEAHKEIEIYQKDCSDLRAIIVEKNKEIEELKRILKSEKEYISVQCRVEEDLKEQIEELINSLEKANARIKELEGGHMVDSEAVKCNHKWIYDGNRKGDVCEICGETD